MTDPAIVNIGAKIELAGLILQLCFFALFACITIHIHNSQRFGLYQRPGSRQMFGCLYASMILLTIRNVYRAVEFAQGFHGESDSLHQLALDNKRAAYQTHLKRVVQQNCLL